MTEDRLERIENLLLRQQNQFEQLSERMTRQDGRMDQLSEQVAQQGQRQEMILYETQRLIGNIGEDASRADAVGQSNRAALEMLTRMIQAVQADILRLQTDIRGVQIENQRILRHLFGDGRED